MSASPVRAPCPAPRRARTAPRATSATTRSASPSRDVSGGDADRVADTLERSRESRVAPYGRLTGGMRGRGDLRPIGQTTCPDSPFPTGHDGNRELGRGCCSCCDRSRGAREERRGQSHWGRSDSSPGSHAGSRRHLSLQATVRPLLVRAVRATPAWRYRHELPLCRAGRLLDRLHVVRGAGAKGEHPGFDIFDPERDEQLPPHDLSGCRDLGELPGHALRSRPR
jgi:hypothetical protein